ncbi:MAG TPA: adenylate/guanylate cyclase domain-containing protein [Candidatus Dormibacteraeota bacterium]|nr:adenylate/guanylate cyclase domain-containing protein [Candidatus Dormibacteraeota bacterium]
MSTERRASGIGAAELIRLMLPSSSSRLTVPQIRYLGKIFALFRWAAGFAVIALVGLLQPPKNPALLALLLLWVAAYNGPASVALTRLNNDAIPWVMRAVTLIDVASYFALLLVFSGAPPAALYAFYATILIEAVAVDGALGAIYSTALFVAGFLGLQGVAAAFFNKPFSAVDVLLWSLAMATVANSMTLVNQVLLQTGDTRVLPGHADQVLRGEVDRPDTFERRKVSVLFGDLVGFTDLADRLEPEDLSPALNQCLTEMAAVAGVHGGAVNSFLGDGILVIFGAPKPLPERAHARAAVDCALAMQEAIIALAPSWRARGISVEPRLRIGVNTGYCTLGVFGSQGLRIYTALGSPVNVASRLQVEAPPGGILSGATTYALVQDHVEAVPRGLVKLRGLARPVEAFEIRGRKAGAAIAG